MSSCPVPGALDGVPSPVAAPAEASPAARCPRPPRPRCRPPPGAASPCPPAAPASPRPASAAWLQRDEREPVGDGAAEGSPGSRPMARPQSAPGAGCRKGKELPSVKPSRWRSQTFSASYQTSLGACGEERGEMCGNRQETEQEKLRPHPRGHFQPLALPPLPSCLPPCPQVRAHEWEELHRAAPTAPKYGTKSAKASPGPGLSPLCSPHLLLCSLPVPPCLLLVPLYSSLTCPLPSLPPLPHLLPFLGCLPAPPSVPRTCL